MRAEKSAVLKRLNYIEGHLKGIRKMVEGDEYCVDILRQTFAVRKAIAGRSATAIITASAKGCLRATGRAAVSTSSRASAIRSQIESMARAAVETRAHAGRRWSWTRRATNESMAATSGGTVLSLSSHSRAGWLTGG